MLRKTTYRYSQCTSYIYEASYIPCNNYQLTGYTKPWIQSLGYKALDTKPWTQSLGYKALDTKPWTQSLGHKALDTKPWKSLGYKALDTKPIFSGGDVY